LCELLCELELCELELCELELCEDEWPEPEPPLAMAGAAIAAATITAAEANKTGRNLEKAFIVLLTLEMVLSCGSRDPFAISYVRGNTLLRQPGEIAANPSKLRTFGLNSPLRWRCIRRHRHRRTVRNGCGRARVVWGRAGGRRASRSGIGRHGRRGTGAAKPIAAATAGAGDRDGKKRYGERFTQHSQCLLTSERIRCLKYAEGRTAVRCWQRTRT
jgi:hypothetical protein